MVCMVTVFTYDLSKEYNTPLLIKTWLEPF